MGKIERKQMKTSISEIKSFLANRRNWYWSGRNGRYLRPTKTTTALRLGSAFHDALENMYMYPNQSINLHRLYEKYNLCKEDQKILKFQSEKYRSLVLPEDLKRFEIIKPEMQYSIQLGESTELFGFIDIVYRNRSNGKYGILEHKFVARPISTRYSELEEQVKAYELALRGISGDEFDKVILNQIIKSPTEFKNIRTEHKQNEHQLKHFRQKLIDTTEEMKKQSKNPIVPYSPHWAEMTFDPYYPLNKKMDLLGTDDTRVITEEDIKKAGLQYKYSR